MNEENKVIAEYMGAVLHENWNNTGLPTWVYEKSNAPTPDSCYNWGADQMQYSTSWDWIMPVYKKVILWAEKNAKVGTGGNPTETTSATTKIISEIEYDLRRANLTDMHKSITRFIKWYNTLNEQK